MKLCFFEAELWRDYQSHMRGREPVRTWGILNFPPLRVALDKQLHYWDVHRIVEEGIRLHDKAGSGVSGIGKHRPLSPHLQIYRPMLTMMMSIAHRVTGAALYFGTLLLAWFLVAASIGGTAYETAAACFNSMPGKVILAGFTWALFHHLLGGIRHLIWDTGRGFEHRQREWLAQATLCGGIALTVLAWGTAYLVK
jgi:succinate dehydrogenase / fumarate reductase, cytochrome b subunit